MNRYHKILQLDLVMFMMTNLVKVMEEMFGGGQGLAPTLKSSGSKGQECVIVEVNQTKDE